MQSSEAIKTTKTKKNALEFCEFSEFHSTLVLFKSVEERSRLTSDSNR